MQYHPDEIQVQERARVRHIADKNNIYTEIPPVAQAFLESQPFLIIGGAQKDGKVWASALFHAPGFIEANDSRTMRVHRLPDADDPLDDCLSPNGQLGTVTVDFASRRRMRTNGIIRERDSSGFTLQVQQAYANCPKFIQARSWTIDTQPRGGRQSLNMAELTDDARGIIEAADTFFIASHYPEYGADVSHRGGRPGFVQVLDERTLWFPDYKGNSMFNTLGNLNGHPEAGLLFLDFDSRSMLQLTGTVQVEWDTDSISAVAGAERIIRFHVRQGRLTAHAMPLTWTFMNYSPVNPK